ncbi:MAG TPA: response regulator [Blastocatellia bacterium]|nr:response regulator [Blastocatellia bacterium]
MEKRILVVEDHAEIRDMMTVTLESLGYEVSVANNGQEGIEQACKDLPDIIITDLRMPKLAGIAMIKQLRQQAECRTIPILVLTAYYRDYAIAALQAGANQVLAKSADFDALHDAVIDLIRKRGREV